MAWSFLTQLPFDLEAELLRVVCRRLASVCQCCVPRTQSSIPRTSCGAAQDPRDRRRWSAREPELAAELISLVGVRCCSSGACELSALQAFALCARLSQPALLLLPCATATLTRRPVAREAYSRSGHCARWLRKPVVHSRDPLLPGT